MSSKWISQALHTLVILNWVDFHRSLGDLHLVLNTGFYKYYIYMLNTWGGEGSEMLKYTKGYIRNRNSKQTMQWST